MVAEGIELPDQMPALRDLGCELGQGFLFAQPDDAWRRHEFLGTSAGARRLRSSAPRVACSIATRRSTAPAASRGPPPRAAAPPRLPRCCGPGMTVSLLGDGVFLVALAWQAYTLSNAPTALSVVGIAMTVPTIVLLLSGGVVSDRFDRRRVMLGGRPRARGWPSACCGAVARPASLELWELVRARRACTAPARRSSPRPSTRSCPTCCPRAELAAGQLARPVRAPDRVSARRPGDRRLRWSARSARAPRSPWTRPRSRVSVVAVLCDAPPGAPRRAACDRAAAIARGALVRPRAHVWLWGTLLSAAFAYLSFLGPAEVLLPFVVKNDLHGSAARAGLVFAAGGIGAVGAAVLMGERGQPRRDDHVHLRLLDAGDAGGGRLRPGHGGLAADARQPRLQRAGDGGHDRLGDAEAAPRAGRDARTGVEPRLADLDRAAAAVVRADGAGRGRGRRADDAGRRRPARRRGDARRRCSCPACSTSSGRRPRRCGCRPPSRRPPKPRSSSEAA